MIPLPGHEQKRVVADGYDAVADAYASWGLRLDDPIKRRFAELAIASSPDGGRLVDLGCGTGEHVTARLHPHFRVTGVDISSRSIELARERTPGPEYLVADMTAVQFASGSIDVVTAFFSLIHVPREEHPAMLGSIADWLRPGGTLIATMGFAAEQSYAEDWLGAPMSWSHWDAETNEQMVRDAGFGIIAAEQISEPGEPFTHLWVVAQKL